MSSLTWRPVQSIIVKLNGCLIIVLPITVPWELDAARTGEMAAQVVTLPVRISIGLAACSLALSLVTGLLTAYVIGRKASKMKPQAILRIMPG